MKKQGKPEKLPLVFRVPMAIGTLAYGAVVWPFHKDRYSLSHKGNR